MIAQGEHISLITLEVHQSEIIAFGQCRFAITHAMTLEVSFSHEIETSRVAELIPTGIVRIVRSANGIDVKLLHDADILTHAIHAHHITTIRIEFMTVNTLDEDGLSVDQQLTTLDFNMTETDSLTNNLQHLVALACGNI